MKLHGETSGVLSAGLISSSQAGVHPKLEKTVRSHLVTRWSQPIHRSTAAVFEKLAKSGALVKGRAIILDSGCGTGASTLELAARHPDHLVIGVDRSLKRLGKSGVSSNLLQRDNCVLARAELASFWRLAHTAGFITGRHLLLYPNPWPKPGHLTRRWHGHPVFPWLLALGGEIEMRCNWEIYALEFAAAVRIATGAVVSVDRIRPEQGISPFETKYHERGQALYSVVVPESVTGAFSLPW